MFELSAEQEQIRSTAREFAEGEIRPLVSIIEGSGRDGRTTREEFLELYRRACSVGFHSLLLPQEFGGAGASCFENVLVQEELGAVDAGLGGALNLTMTVAQLIALAGTDEQRGPWLEEICRSDDHVLAGALNEPGVAGSDLMSPHDDPAIGIRTRARLDGDEYVIDGSKVAFVTNGGVAKAYFVFARTDLAVSAAKGVSIFYVPAETVGLSVGARADLLGLRSGWHAELHLDSARVPATRRIGREGQGFELMATTAPMAIGLAATFVGLARAAHETALAWANERISWGVPIRRHQAVALRLADMAVAVQTARLVVWDAAAAYDTGRFDELAVKVPAAKSHAVDVAIDVAGNAVRIMGGAGVSKGVLSERLIRDAWTGYSCDFTGDMLRLGLAEAL